MSEGSLSYNSIF